MLKKLTMISTLLLLTACSPTKDMAPGEFEPDEPIIATEIEEDIVEDETDDNDVSQNDNDLNEDSDFSEVLASLPTPDDLPLDVDYIEINNNIPLFTNADLEIAEPYHSYEELDYLGRVGEANALLDVSLMPAGDRGSISHIKPTGWMQQKYEVVSGGWLYNRSHLIGHQMTGYDGEDNLMTGTRQFNVEGMLPFENFVANTVSQDELQVRYRIRPIYQEDNLLAHGITMEGFSVDDDGATLTFNIFVPNQQDGVTINYATGESYVN